MMCLAVDGSAQVPLRSSGGATTSALAERLTQYQAGVGEAAPITRDELWSGAGAFRRTATTWIDAGDPRAASTRRLAVATYVLDLLKEFEEPALWTATQPAITFLEWACTTLRKSPPLAAEPAWHTAAFALMERSGPADVIEDHLEHAEARLPNDERWALVRILVDQRKTETVVSAPTTRRMPAPDSSMAGRRDDGALSIPQALASRARQHFEQAAARDSTRDEALIRWGAFESDLGRQDAALAHFDRAGRPADPALRYWLGLTKGRALERANRSADAIDMYRHVVAEFPHAQVAAFSLAAALVDAHRVEEASAIVAGTVSLPSGPLPPDPWDFYRVPDVRLWPQAMTELRRAVAR